MESPHLKDALPTLSNPFDTTSQSSFSRANTSKGASHPTSNQESRYEVAIQHGLALQARPTESVSKVAIRRQHQKGRMTIWERIQVLADGDPMILFQNWGPNNPICQSPSKPNWGFWERSQSTRLAELVSKLLFSR